MPNLSVKDVPEQWADALRQRAVRNHRSLQGELMAIIERAVLEPSTSTAPPDNAVLGDTTIRSLSGRGTAVGLDRFGHSIVRQGWKTVDQVATELKAKYPEPVTDVPRGADIIRADRDAR